MPETHQHNEQDQPLEAAMKELRVSMEELARALEALSTELAEQKEERARVGRFSIAQFREWK